jgi:ABC-2 type transport system permease protein
MSGSLGWALPCMADCWVSPLKDYATQTFAVADAEVRKLRHDPSELLPRAIQPAI